MLWPSRLVFFPHPLLQAIDSQGVPIEYLFCHCTRLGRGQHALGDLLIERSSLDYMKANVGDSMQIEMPDGKLRELRVAGVVRDLTAVPPIYGRMPKSV